MPRQIPYPNHEQCKAVIAELLSHNEATKGKDLNAFEQDFISKNKERRWFTEPQKEVIRNFAAKYVLQSFP